ncbi:TPA: major tail protein [Streptococcus pyogenes]|uniref:major tail protein n=1 Tax=Streptococcus pyogenes TaxID=1314 RepID=UPI000A1D97DF|nr:major tail protein [Streptococcus pyogenes]OUI73305.1 phage tail protein [Streptococcus pyogenes]VGT97994.1 major tail protein [Streptococcus pyogenes]VGU19276.1 major tail protein [Streptococcus pyogenes]VGV66062.1 major tail protein [Streptococcus pyogenes]VGZ95369.1 major tail protein [Streptococcus pyogenes]
MGKVKFGLRDFYYGVLDDKDMVKDKGAGIKHLPGMKSAKLDITNELVTVSADDGPYVVLSGGITETKLEIEVLDLTSDARKDFFGITVEKGVEKYNRSLTPKDVACVFRTSDENGKAIWVGLLKGKFNLPGMEAQTKEGAPDPKPDSVTGNFVARGKDGDVILIGRGGADGFKINDFLKCVFDGCQDVDIKKIPIAERTSEVM